VTFADVLVMRPLQWLFPLLSTGLILDGVLGSVVTDTIHHEVASAQRRS
jgi:hypothetical protein